MRVLFVTGEYPVMQGGVGDYTWRLGQALCQMGVDVAVLTHANAGADHLRSGSAYEPSVYPVMTGTGWGLWQQVRHLVNEIHPHVVHVQYQTAAYGLHPAANWLPWYLTRSRSRPAVYTTFHDLRVPYMFPKAGPLRKRSVLALARYSDAAVVTNPGDWAELVASDQRLAARLRPIPIGSNIHPQPPAGYDRTAQRAAWGAGHGDWLLAYFGFLNANKGGETLVRGLAELRKAGRPARLLMVGGQVGASDPTNATYLAHVEALISELGLNDYVRWTGFTEPDQVSANLLAADCAVLPYREGASLRHGSLMAALAHGLPIVTTVMPASGPFIKQARQVFPTYEDGASAMMVPPEDPVRLAAAVTQVMTEQGLKARLAAGALAMSRMFAWDTIASQHLVLYHERSGGAW
jgi:polysaccharide biosynthesis protein PslF